MPPVLYLDHQPSEPADAETRIFRFASGMITLGREEGNDIVILSSALSRQHARILPAGNHWAFCDLGSTNGSWLNDKKLEKDRLVLIRNQDELILADAHFTVRLEVTAENPGARYNRSLLVFEGENFHSEFPMSSDTAEFIVGGKDSHLKVGEVTQLQIGINDNNLSLSVKDSSNGALINGEPLLADRILKDGDFIIVGKKSILVNYSDRSTEFYTAPVGSVDIPTFEAEEEYQVDESFEELPPILAAQSSSPSWESQAKAGTSTNRRFIFGDDASSSARTVGLPPEQNPFRGGKGQKGQPGRVDNQTGFEMSLSGRMASVPVSSEQSFAKEQQRRMILGITFIAFALLLGLAVIIMLVLN